MATCLYWPYQDGFMMSGYLFVSSFAIDSCVSVCDSRNLTKLPTFRCERQTNNRKTCALWIHCAPNSMWPCKWWCVFCIWITVNQCAQNYHTENVYDVNIPFIWNGIRWWCEEWMWTMRTHLFCLVSCIDREIHELHADIVID